MPREIAALSPVAAKIIRPGHVCCSLLRVTLPLKTYHKMKDLGAEIPQFVTGNVMAHPQYSEDLPLVLGKLPSQLAEVLQVQFEGSRESIKKEQLINVSIPVLKDAFK